MQKSKSITDILKKSLCAVIYGICSGIGINFFLSPCGLYTGGITGLSQLLSNLTEKLLKTNVPTWAWMLIFNIPLVIAGFIFLGKRFTVFSFISIIASSVAIKFIPLLNITQDPILCAVFGGIIIGFGTGLCFRCGFSTGGVDFIIFFIQKKKGRTVGELSMILNGCIAVAVGLIYGTEPALYSIIAIFVNNKLLNAFYIQQYNVTVSIFTQKRDEVLEALNKISIHGASYMENVYGGYTDTPICLVVSVITKYELLLLKDAISAVDKQAFINVQPTSEIIGFFKKNPV